MNRFDALRDLIGFNKPVSVLSDTLKNYEWDYDGEPFIITPLYVRKILIRFLNKEFSAQDLEDWANLIEGREDLEFEEAYNDEIENIIYSLANPVLQGEITFDSCSQLLKTLG
uniref:hypothetical protein n=1 Tax=Halomonas sp. TaxID=1486246 RepID=UPI00263684F9|nr:hypothetical protein [Halomonas sp.]